MTSTCLEAVDEAQKQCLLHLANPSEVNPGDAEGVQVWQDARDVEEVWGLIKTTGPLDSRWRGACEPPCNALRCPGLQ